MENAMPKERKWTLLIAIPCLLWLGPPALAEWEGCDTLAFPDAFGFGSCATGGRGGDVYYVTHGGDDGFRSLREGVSTAPPEGRTIVFSFSGDVLLDSPLILNRPKLTIAGQTAPGDGIQVRFADGQGGNNPMVRIAASDIVIQNIRFRPGPSSVPGGGSNLDAVAISAGAERVILDLVSLTWGEDEVLSITNGASFITVQRSIIAEGLYCANHKKTLDPCPPNRSADCDKCPLTPGFPHSRLINVGTGSGPSPMYVSLLNNVWSTAEMRFPNVHGNLVIDVRGNASHNFEKKGVELVCDDHQTDAVKMNYWYNSAVPGEETHASAKVLSSGLDSGQACGHEVYLYNPPGDEEPFPFFGIEVAGPNFFGGQVVELTEPVDVPPSPSIGLELTAFPELDETGAQPTDATDQRIYDNLLNQMGKFRNEPDWPILFETSFLGDHDGDGMPDCWEYAHGLDPTNYHDRNNLYDDGDPLTDYTELERFLWSTIGTDTPEGCE